MIKKIRIFAFTLILSLGTCLPSIIAQQTPPIIPKPNAITMSEGSLDLTKGVTIQAMSGKDWEGAIDLFIERLKALGIKAEKTDARTNTVVHFQFMQNMDRSGKNEAYRITVTGNGLVRIASTSAAGAFYAGQTILQSIQNGQLPLMRIEDAPRFTYRGMHLDVSRHFFPPSFIKQYIDLLAAYKINTFHWHLTDDQGWRIEIKKYPKLQEIAAYRPETLIGHYNANPQQFDGKPYGGYYTQEEVREIVAYAAARFITVIPEIEMPGHAQAALSAYPQLSCTGLPVQAATKWGVFEDVFCTKDETFTFLQDVLTEVIDLFPSSYLHIGGDECPKERWKTCPVCQNRIKDLGLKDEHELQSYFIKRIETFLATHNRKIIGWDEILEGGLAPNATVMSWRGISGGIEAARAGHDVVMTPTSHCYFDYYQSDATDEPLAIGGLLPLEKVYSYEPVPTELNAEEAKHILGTQANIWTEYLPTPDAVTYMLLPRMPALAEVGWTMPQNKSLSDFVRRLQPQFEQWKKAGIKYANTTTDVKTKIISGDGNGVRLQLFTLADQSAIQYTINAEAAQHTYTSEIMLQNEMRIDAFTNAKEQKSSRNVHLQFQDHLAAGAKVSLQNMPALKYSGGGIGSPFNGIDGSDARYGDAEWLGFEGQDFVANLDMGIEKPVSSIDFRFYHAPGQWIYAPSSVDVYAMPNHVLIGSITPPPTDSTILQVHLNVKPTQTKDLLIEVHNFGTIPAGAQGAGYKAWLFVDEVRVH